MSWRSCSARSRLVLPVLTFVPLMRVTYWLLEHRRHRLDRSTGSRRSARGPSPRARPPCGRPCRRRPGMGSQAPNTMSSRAASGTKSLISGDRFSVRLPRRMVAIWVSEPMGLARPRRMLSTPAMKVVATAPRPGVRIPSLPEAGATLDGAELLDIHKGFLGRGSMDEADALDGGYPCGHGQKQDDPHEDPAMQREAEKGLWYG